MIDKEEREIQVNEDYLKKITELEYKIEGLEKDLADYQFNYPTIKELEHENAELKEQNRNLLESCEGATMMYEDLCKAKEIIKMVIDSYNHKERFFFEKDLMKAEQFLKG